MTCPSDKASGRIVLVVAALDADKGLLGDVLGVLVAGEVPAAIAADLGLQGLECPVDLAVAPA